jgi:hypothetical protein
MTTQLFHRRMATAWLSIAITASLCFVSAPAAGQGSAEFKNSAEMYQAARWSQPTNGVQFGLLVTTIRTTNKPQDLEVTLILNAVSTNRVIVWLPPESQRYKLDMADGQGNAVNKTSRGRKLDAPMRRTLKSLESQGYVPIWTTGDLVIVPERNNMLSDWFQMKTPGPYILRGEVHALVVIPNGELIPTTFTLPAIRVDIPPL